MKVTPLANYYVLLHFYNLHLNTTAMKVTPLANYNVMLHFYNLQLNTTAMKVTPLANYNVLLHFHNLQWNTTDMKNCKLFYPALQPTTHLSHYFVQDGVQLSQKA